MLGGLVVTKTPEDEAILLDPFSAMRKLGVMLVQDDIKDVGKLDRPHHWQWGTLLYVLSFPLELYLKKTLPEDIVKVFGSG